MTFTFSTAITNFSFTYGNETNAPSNPGNQWITLYDISFDAKPKVPEWHPGLIAALLCFGLVGSAGSSSDLRFISLFALRANLNGRKPLLKLARLFP